MCLMVCDCRTTDSSTSKVSPSELFNTIVLAGDEDIVAGADDLAVAAAKKNDAEETKKPNRREDKDVKIGCSPLVYIDMMN